MFKNTPFEAIAKTMSESAPKMNPAALQEAIKPVQDNLKAWADLAQVQAKEAQAVMTETVGATSHSCRVTFISRCHRAGLSESEAMNLVNHSTRMIHRIYSRLNVEDARNALGRVPLLPPRPRGIRAPSAKSSSGRKKGSPAT